MLKYELPVDGPFAGAWVGFSEAWSRKDERAFWQAEAEETFGILVSKLEAIHLPTMDGGWLNSVADLTEERLDDLDQRLLTWLGGAAVVALVEAKQLGEALRRPLFERLEKKAADASRKS